FTGIVEEVGKIKGIHRGVHSEQIEISAKKVLEDAKVGDSICTNGVCLTISKLLKNSFVADVMHETLDCSTLGEMPLGAKVNLERAMMLNGRFGGHIVSGHIDGMGMLVKVYKDDNSRRMWVETSSEILKYIVRKGSVALNGVSLTVASVGENNFEVSVIPHTWENTSFAELFVGNKINIENDILGKYVENFLSSNRECEAKKQLTEDFLEENGFF
ncbi:MAG TPA: riboflavin synthase, partial [Porphyromonadaceae bacterium]|nr:riboflavin synthase [Porphyromonadaceae bacterium]